MTVLSTSRPRATNLASNQIIGQFTGGYVSDRFGRKMSFWNVIFWTYIGVMLEVIATTWQMWLGSKIVIGFATGMMQSVVPTYVAEVAPRELRGIMLSFFNMASEWR
jgi:MFS family permease